MTWAITAVAVTVASGAMQAETTARMAQIQEGVDQLNSQYADLDAYNAAQRGDTESARYEDTIQQVEGEQQVAEASKNVSTTFGTASEINAQTKLTGFLNQLDIQKQANQQAMGYKVQSLNLQNEAASTALGAQVQETGELATGTFQSITGYASSQQKPNTSVTNNYYGNGGDS